MITQTADGWELLLHIQPAAKHTELAGPHGDAIKLRIQAPPVDGKANAEVCRFIAELFAEKKQNVSISSGHSSRRKRVQVLSHSPLPAELREYLSP